MHITMLWRFTAFLFLIGGMLAASAIPVTHPFADGASAGAAQKDKSGKDKEDKDKQEQEDHKDKSATSPVEPDAGYGIDVACTVAGDATRTACTFSAVTPAGGKAPSDLVIPEDTVCARVIGGDFSTVAPDPITNVTGYRATGHGSSTLVLNGQITLGGSATYWIKAANEVFPAPGARLVCGDLAASTTTESTPPTATVAMPTTGTVRVNTYTCTGVPADTSAFDWYSACAAGGEHRYALTLAAGDATDAHATDTANTGAATFLGLPPGTYDLHDVNAKWCHAESNNVNAQGNVVVEANKETTVWFFYCDGTGS